MLQIIQILNESITTYVLMINHKHATQSLHRTVALVLLHESL